MKEYRIDRKVNEEYENEPITLTIGGGETAPNDVISESVKTIESFKLRAKGLHWAAEDDKIHILCDELYDDLCDAQDKIAEIYMGWRSVKFPSDYLTGVECAVSDNYESLVTEISDHAIWAIDAVKDHTEWYGAKGVYEELLAKMQQGKYRQTQR